MFQNTNVVFLNTFNAILNIMDANACVPSVEFIYSVIMTICLSFPGPVFSQCKVANSELLLHSHTCEQLSYCYETSSRHVFHCHSNVRAGTYSCHSRH